ncbi:MAG: hypothetical protein JO061_20115, partial [Acidobacteriaceae bacterium]|nr:hypothetical protein [Acidobacteriaceae bacterium]
MKICLFALLLVVFQDIAARVGIKDVFPNGGSVSKQYILETTGSGIAFIDY